MSRFTAKSAAFVNLSAIAGMAAPIIFVALVIGQGAIYQEYNHRTMMISDLAAAPDGIVQNVNFFLTGGSFVLLGLGLREFLKRDVVGQTASFLIALSGLGLIVAGAIPHELRDGVIFQPPGHIGGSIFAFLTGGAGLVLLSLSRRARADKSSLVQLIRCGGGATILCFVAFAALAVPPEGALHANIGLAQRVLVVTWFASVFLAALWLLRRSRQSISI